MTPTASAHAEQLMRQLADGCDNVRVLAISSQGSALVLVIDEANESTMFVPDCAERSDDELRSQRFEPIDGDALAKLRSISRPGIRVH